MPIRRRQPSSSTVQSFCFTFSHRVVRPPSYAPASSLVKRPSSPRRITGETSEISLAFESDVGHARRVRLQDAERDAVERRVDAGRLAPPADGTR